MSKSKFDMERRTLLPGYESGRYEPRRIYDHSEWAEQVMKRDNRIHVRISGRDLKELQARALEEGVPYQSLVASIIRKYLRGDLQEGESSIEEVEAQTPKPEAEQD